MKEKICVVGLGYIGLPTALMLASKGHDVCGMDINENLVNMLRRGELPFEEEGIEQVFAEARKNGLCFSSVMVPADIYIIAVQTPYIKASKKIDPSYVVSALKNVLSVCGDGAVVVIESTVSPGTIDKHVRPVVSASGKKVHLVHAPERIIPGSMVYELTKNSRTIGADDPEVCAKVKDVYASFCQNEIVMTDIRTAEMTKVVENTYRDVNIAFANELLRICREDNLDVYEIIRIANKHPRVNIHNPGPGVGGHCISVDPWFLVGDYPGLANLILTARKINDSMPEYVLNVMSDIMEKHGITDNSRVGLYGLTYKENVDDTRESPTLQLLDRMKRNLGKGLRVYDPYARKNVCPGQMHNFDEFLDAVDMVVVMVAHNHIKENMDCLRGKVVLDTRNVCPPDMCYKL